MQGLRLIFIATMLLGLCACSTVKGFGQDLQKLGDKIESKASK